jgi:hypothetical protein
MSQSTTVHSELPTSRRPLSAGILGLLSLIPVGVLLVAQALRIGFFQTLGGVVPISDSNLWASCASALASGHDSYNLAWCARRPLTVLLEAPFFVVAPTSLAAVVLLQLLVVCLMFWWFIWSVSRSLALGRAALLAIIGVGLFPVFWYGTYLGPEGVALGLTLISAGAAVRFLATTWLPWGLVATGVAIVVLLIRPGNVVLTGALLIGLLVIMRRTGSRWLAVGAVAVGMVLLFALPSRLLTLAGWPAAGHASNFWATAYSAATPEQDTWVSAYDRFGPALGCPPVADWGPDPCLQLENEQFGQSIRDAALSMVAANPLGIPRQMAVNVGQLAADGYLNAIWGNPFAASATPWTVVADDDGSAWIYVAGSVIASLLWLASIGFLVLLAVRLARLGREADPLRRDAVRRRASVAGGAMWLGLVTVVGVVASYALVGHDEGQRHLVQSIPFILLGFAGLMSHLHPDSGGVLTAPRQRWSIITVWASVALVVVGAAVEGRSSSPSLVVTRDCGDEGAAQEEYDVVAVAPVGARSPLASPPDWRRDTGAATRVAFAERSWAQQLLDLLPPGQILDIRSRSTGEILPVFLSDEDAARAADGELWCTSAPSRHGVMVVHDLLPAV